MTPRVTLLRSLELARAVPLLLAARAEDGVLREAAWAERLLRDFLARDLGRFFVAERAGEPVGYLALVWGYSLSRAAVVGHVQEVFVLPGARGAGTGQALLEHAERAARAYGACGMHLETDLGNAPARTLYARAGYEYLPGRAVYLKHFG